MEGTVRVPNPVVRVKRMSAGIVSLAIEAPVESASFCDVAHPIERVVQGGVEDPTLLVTAAGYGDLRKLVFPHLTGRALHSREAGIAEVGLKILLRLLDTDVREAHLQLQWKWQPVLQ